MRESPEIPIRLAATRRIADEWALVLVSQGLLSSVRKTDDGHVLCVPRDQADRAVATLASYDLENPPRTRDPDENAGASQLGAASLVSAALLAFFLVTGARDPASVWFESGSADAARILADEPWRAITALTLHADIGHVFSNAVVGAFFFAAVFRALGPGLGLLLVVLAGAGGNFANALAHVSHHVSVGASTSVFGAVGILAGLAVARRRRFGARGNRVFVPIAAGLGLLAMIGTGSAPVDLWAHFFGLVFGTALGLVTGVVRPRAPSLAAQWLLAGAALATIFGCWSLALRS